MIHPLFVMKGKNVIITHKTRKRFIVKKAAICAINSRMINSEKLVFVLYAKSIKKKDYRFDEGTNRKCLKHLKKQASLEKITSLFKIMNCILPYDQAKIDIICITDLKYPMRESKIQQ